MVVLAHIEILSGQVYGLVTIQDPRTIEQPMVCEPMTALMKRAATHRLADLDARMDAGDGSS